MHGPETGILPLRDEIAFLVEIAEFLDDLHSQFAEIRDYWKAWPKSMGARMTMSANYGLRVVSCRMSSLGRRHGIVLSVVYFIFALFLRDGN